MESWDPNLVADAPVVDLPQEIPYTAPLLPTLEAALQQLGVLTDNELESFIGSMKDYDLYAEAVNNGVATVDVGTHVVTLLKWLNMTVGNLLTLVDPHAGDAQQTAHGQLSEFHLAFTQTLALFAGRGYQ